MKRKFALAMVLLLVFMTSAVYAQEEFHLHAWRQGACDTLTGDVMLILFFVNTPHSSWTAKESDRVINKTRDSIAYLMKEAGRYDVYLNIQLSTANISTQYEPLNDRETKWYWDIMGQYGFTGMQQLHDTWEPYYGVDDLAVLFVFDQEARSYSHNAQAGSAWNEECSVIYAKHENDLSFTIVHETLHLFGAIDLYYPKTVRKAAEKVYPDSVMLRGGKTHVDSLTACLIGWTNYYDKKAQRFLEKVRDVTLDDYWAGLDEVFSN